MRRRLCTAMLSIASSILLGMLLNIPASAATAGRPGASDLTIASGGKTAAVVVVAEKAGPHERKAAEDLVKYIELMSGAKPTLAASVESGRAAFGGGGPVLVVGQAALAARPALQAKITAALKKNPKLGADGIALVRDGNLVLLAGNNDVSHYYAVAELLKLWGCRWYVPTEFGECVPDERELKVGDLDYAYGSPFEIRSYWISWVGDTSGQVDFQLRNMLQNGRAGMPNTGHALDAYTKDAPGSKGMFNFPITAPETAQHVASKVEKMFASNESFSLGMEDGSYESAYPRDQELMKLQYDKYFMRTSVTDPMLELYNNVAKILQAKHPQSKSKIGFLAYANMTIPPVREMKAEPSLWCELAPIDIDPIHGMDDSRSPPRQEYRDMVYKWSKVMDGRVSIYDYDQGMLVWRDIPNPSHMAFRQDVKHYLKAGVLGVNTESRNAIGTVFLNLFFRGQLLWNPDADVDALLAEFYPKFYGPAAEPMRAYWTAIYRAWEETLATEHEHFVVPAIYTPALLKVLERELTAAEAAIAPLKAKSGRSRNENRYVERMTFTRLSFDILKGYTSMVAAAATDVDYAKAAALGEAALAAREKLTDMNGTFTTYRAYGAEKGGSPAWFPGEVAHYKKLAALTDGPNGKLVIKLPLTWSFHRDNDHTGVAKGYHSQPVDLSYWKMHESEQTPEKRKDYPIARWEMLNTDLYAQAQGILHPDRQSYLGSLWYRTDVELTADQVTGNIHVMFPGLFCECRLFVNGEEIAHRKQGKLWWLNDYAFEWDVPLAGKLKPGRNTITVQSICEHHFGGLFRRPFLYKATAGK